MIEVRETRLPGVGKKFTMRTQRGEDVCAVVHIDGRRELYYRPDPDEDAGAVIVLTDEEAQELGSILGGVVYRPELLDHLEVALSDLAIEWIDIPDDSPLVGRTVATCRIRTTTGGTIVAIIRPEGAMAMPHPDEVIRAGDTLVVITTPETFAAIQRLVAEGPPADAA
ncbi:MAG: cation:proton antiporter regulatory subunit [Actinobacteria bacterium]|nr:cation:proton antiporter regulatory subunit [Actinomycetota bacterium]